MPLKYVCQSLHIRVDLIVSPNRRDLVSSGWDGNDTNKRSKERRAKR